MTRTLLLPILLAGGAVAAQPPGAKKPDGAKPVDTQIPFETRRAWEKLADGATKTAGAVFDDRWGTVKYTPKQDPYGLPVFVVYDPKAADFDKLPDPAVPFGIATPADVPLDKLARFKTLTMLHLSSSAWTEDRAKNLAGLTQLRRLDVVTGPEWKLVLGAVGKLTDLEALDLSFGNDTFKEPHSLAPLAGLKKLRHLKVDFLQRGPGVFQPLAGLTDLRSLRVQCKLTDDDLAALGGLPNLAAVEFRDVTAVTGKGVKALAGLKKLQYLEIRGSKTAVGDDGLEAVARMPAIETVILYRAPVTDAGLKHLSKSTTLRRLELESAKVTDAGLAHLAGVKQLQRLDLSWTAVTDAGLKHLAGLTELKTVILTGTRVTDAGVAGLKAAIPGVRVMR